MDDLTRPLTLRSGVTLANRMALAPLTNRQSNSDGTLGEDELRWLLRRARGGFGFLSTCATYVAEEGKAWDGQLGIARDDHTPGLARLATALRAEGATPIVQLHHAGRIASRAPGARLGPAEEEEGVRAASAADLQRVVDQFVSASQRALEAGFQGVEIHGANGYLFTQFLAPADNPRTDAWGGDLPSRARLLRDTVRAVRSALPSDFAVGVRLSPVDVWSRRGLLLEDGAQVSGWMAEDGVDWVHLSLPDVVASPPHEDTTQSVASAVREALPSEVALLAAGGVWTAADAARAVAVGVDVPVVGRAAIAHPDWPRAVWDDGFAPTRPPWRPAHLRDADVGPAFVDYLSGFPGMVHGGRPARD